MCFAWCDRPLTWWTDQLLSFSAWHCRLGHLTCKNLIVPDMTYNVFGGTLNPTLLYYCVCSQRLRDWHSNLWRLRLCFHWQYCTTYTFLCYYSACHYNKLDAGHSIECITHAGHSIAFFTLCDNVTLTSWLFEPNINWWARYRDGLSLCQVWGDFSFSSFGFIVRSDRQTDRRTHT